jgi:hypothetical protein
MCIPLCGAGSDHYMAHLQSGTKKDDAIVLPFFIKLHKVASSTTASLFNCVATEHREYYRGMLAVYDQCNIKHTAWSHMNMNELGNILFYLFSATYLNTVSITFS